MLRGGFGINTVDIRFPNALQQFDEYQAQVVQQRAPGDPRPLFQLSQGPAPVVLQRSAQQHGAPMSAPTTARATSIWMDGNLHPGYVVNWNATVEYQVSANNLLKLMYQGSAGVHLVESWNVNVFPTDFGAEQPGSAGRRLCRAAELSALPAVRQHQLHVQHRPLQLPRRHRAVLRSATRKAWC